MPTPFNLDQTRDRLKQTMITLPREIGLLAVNFSKDRFRAGGWYDKTFLPWKARNPKAKRNSGRAILVQSGSLRRSIRVVRVTNDSVTIGSDVPYAKAHNEGMNALVTVRTHARNQYKKEKVGNGKIGKRGRQGMKTITTIAGVSQVGHHVRHMKMPQRQFMGQSDYLTRIIGRKINTEILKAFKP